ncbi:MAG: hypothetical protein EXQ91_05215 [Alphaproteobacteria bacterium]|nr:hypothetical protein [Alphaproteobacteria bacterium]
MIKIGDMSYALSIQIVAALVLVYPAWRTLRRAGLPGALAILVFVPWIGLAIVFAIIAFVGWPELAHPGMELKKREHP